MRKASSKNVTQLGIEFIEAFKESKVSASEIRDLSAMITALAKTKKVELEYHQLRGTLINMPKIDWFEDESTGKSN